MSENIKHECAVAFLRLRKSREYFASKYSTSDYALEKMTILLEKQHNRGQDGAGIAALHLAPEPGTAAYNIEKSAAGNPLNDLLKKVSFHKAEFQGELLLGHLRYATFGRNDIHCCYPFVHENSCLERVLLLAGNFNLTDNRKLLENLVNSGHHPACSSDGYLLLQTIAHYLEKEVNIHGDSPDYAKILRKALDELDGAFTLCGITGNGDAFAIRDPHGIRPGYYYMDEEVIAVASERSAIQAAFNCSSAEVHELPPGKALIISKSGNVEFADCLTPRERRSCVFERIYFSRANDCDIHRERRKLGAALVPAVLEAVKNDFRNTFFSYIPNSAQVAFHGLLSELCCIAAKQNQTLRFGQIAVKDAKFRTFITDPAHRQSIYQHVYDVTYGLVHPGSDNLVVLDDSIVRGNTMRNAILPMLDRLDPARIIVASSAPPVKYPDCYGIDMATAGELIAFQALISCLKKRSQTNLLDQAYRSAKQELASGKCRINCMKILYDAVPNEELCREVARLLKPEGLKSELTVVYQSCENLQKCLPDHTGDWYFTGNYPTAGGVKVANQALVDFVEHVNKRAY